MTIPPLATLNVPLILSAAALVCAGFAAIWAVGKVIAILKDDNYDRSMLQDLYDDMDDPSGRYR